MNKIASRHAHLVASFCLAVTPSVALAQPRPGTADVAAGSGVVITLAALEQQALASRQSLSAQQARIRAASAEVERRLSADRPSATLASDVSFSPGGTLEHVAASDLDPAHEILVQGVQSLGQPYAFAAQGRYGATLDVSKNLYDFGRTALAVEAARAQQEAATADDRATRRQVIDDVRAAYLGWLSATELAGISQEALSDAQSRQKRVTDLVAEGSKPAADISPVASDEALARIELSRARADVVNARIMLEAAVGGSLPPGAQPDRGALQLDVAPPAVPPAADTAGRTGSATDAGVESLERQRDAAEATASMYERQNAPTIGAEAQLGVRAQNPIAGGGSSAVFPIYRVGVSVSVPLWDGGAAQANAGVARAQAEELAARSREAAQARQTARTQAEADASAAQDRLRIARELLELSDRRVREAEARYEEARGPIEAIAEATAMRRRANTEIVLAEIAAARAHFTLQDQ